MATIPKKTQQTRDRNSEVLARAKATIAGGDNSTMRVLSYHLPLIADRGEGARVWDIEGREYIDLNMAYGPLLFGHRPEKILDAVSFQIHKSGSQLGFPTEISIRTAEKLKALFPMMELVRFSSTGTEAVASATRLARAHTGRSKIIAFEGHYHGWSDAVFHRYHAPLDQLPADRMGPALPGTIGMNGAPHDLITVEWNDAELLERCLAQHRGQVAAVIMEPIAGNSGVLEAQPGFLAEAKRLAHEDGALLIFDEVITGLRVAAGGAQQLYGVTPDITIVSKALGGGFPVAAFGASAEIMSHIAAARMFHGGVYSGNAAVMAAAEAMLDEITEHGEQIYGHLHAQADRLAAGLGEIMTRHNVPHVMQHVGPMLSLFLTTGRREPLTTYREVRQHADFEKYIEFQHALQRAGVYFHPNLFEPMYLSTAHTADDLDEVFERVEDACRCLWPR
ncbi:MAG: aspartate aminotransferase family protein [Pirellulales bacterium]|nr:aspartate aminotransferase family protein [Pirellulales bacterium]